MKMKIKIKMRKKSVVILVSLFFVLSLTSCDEKSQVKDDGHSIINYTDTGDVASSMGSRTAEYEYNPVNSEEPVVSKSTEKKTEHSVLVSEVSSSASSGSHTSSVTDNTVHTITYYYTIEPGEDDVEVSTHTADDTESDVSRLDTDSDFVSDSDDTDTDTDSDTANEQVGSENPVEVGSFSEEDMVFLINEGNIYLGDDIESVKEPLGEIKSVEAVPVQSDPDIENQIYNYDDFWLMAVPDEDSVYRVEEIQIFNDNISTSKGIKVGMTVTDVLKAYGLSSSITNDEYRYYTGNQYMYFYIQNGIIGNIGYRIDHSVDNDSD